MREGKKTERLSSNETEKIGRSTYSFTFFFLAIRKLELYFEQRTFFKYLSWFLAGYLFFRMSSMIKT